MDNYLIEDWVSFFDCRHVKDTYYYIGQVNARNGDMEGWAICCHMSGDVDCVHVLGAEEVGKISIFDTVDNAIGSTWEYFQSSVNVHFYDRYCIDINDKADCVNGLYLDKRHHDVNISLKDLIKKLKTNK